MHLKADYLQVGDDAINAVAGGGGDLSAPAVTLKKGTVWEVVGKHAGLIGAAGTERGSVFLKKSTGEVLARLSADGAGPTSLQQNLNDPLDIIGPFDNDTDVLLGVDNAVPDPLAAHAKFVLKRMIANPDTASYV